jgi:hypothetical protein
VTGIDPWQASGPLSSLCLFFLLSVYECADGRSTRSDIIRQDKRKWARITLERERGTQVRRRRKRDRSSQIWSYAAAVWSEVRTRSIHPPLPQLLSFHTERKKNERTSVCRNWSVILVLDWMNIRPPSFFYPVG